MTTPTKDAQPELVTLQRRKYKKIVLDLWMRGPTEANAAYPTVSVSEFTTANAYYDSLRCDGCFCGSCVNLPELASNLDKSPKDLQPIATLAKELVDKELQDSKK